MLTHTDITSSRQQLNKNENATDSFTDIFRICFYISLKRTGSGSKCSLNICSGFLSMQITDISMLEGFYIHIRYVFHIRISYPGLPLVMHQYSFICALTQKFSFILLHIKFNYIPTRLRQLWMNCISNLKTHFTHVSNKFKFIIK